MKNNSKSRNRSFILFTFIASISMIAFIYFRFSYFIPAAQDPKWGMAIDSFNNVKVFYNGEVSTTNGRNKTEDGYNLGMKYQCVEFVKRYYYEHLHHKMPDSYGNAKDFFDSDLKDGDYNAKRNLMQYSNPSKTKPVEDDLIIFDGHIGNSYGHVAIVCEATDDHLTIIQQNPGSTAPSRVSISLKKEGDQWQINNSRILGWLRKE